MEVAGEGLVPLQPERAASDRGSPWARGREGNQPASAVRFAHLVACHPHIFSSKRNTLFVFTRFQYHVQDGTAGEVTGWGFQTRGHLSSLWAGKGFGRWRWLCAFDQSAEATEHVGAKPGDGGLERRRARPLRARSSDPEGEAPARTFTRQSEAGYGGGKTR